MSDSESKKYVAWCEETIALSTTAPHGYEEGFMKDKIDRGYYDGVYLLGYSPHEALARFAIVAGKLEMII